MTVTLPESSVIESTVQEFTQTIPITILETTVVATIDETATATVATTTDVTQTDINTVTVTDTPVLRRRVTSDSSSSPASGATCTAETIVPGSVPMYASACSGTARYSSACSCAGFTSATTIVTAPVVTSTTTSTVYLSPTTTVIATLSSDVSVTVSVTETVPSTLTTTATTITTFDVVATMTVTVDATSTVTVQAACTSGYHFVVTSGAYAGNFIVNDPLGSSPPDYSFIRFQLATTTPTRYFIREDGAVYDENNEYSWASLSRASHYFVLQMTDYGRAIRDVPQMRCSIDPSATGGVPGSIGILACTVSGSPTMLVSYNSNYLYQEKMPEQSDSVARVAVVPISCQ